MSQSQPIDIACPECTQQKEVIAWTLLNVQDNPEAKVEFFEGKINLFECDACGHKGHLAVQFLYHDMDLAYCAQYYPPEYMDDDRMLGMYDVNGVSNADLYGDDEPSGEVIQQTSYMLRPHIVFSMPELFYYVVFREKLAAFHARQ